MYETNNNTNQTTINDELETQESSMDNQQDIADDNQPIEELQKKVEEQSNALLRAQAEVENIKKRVAREIERARKYALEGFAMRLLDVKDNLERSLQVDIEQESSGKKLREGSDLTLKSLLQVFSDFGLKELDPQGEDFNPEFHQAIVSIDSDNHQANAIIEVMQKGYLLHDRLLRPAMVTVAAAKTEKPSEESGKPPSTTESKAAKTEKPSEESGEDSDK